jgi:hypothetical protein
MLGRKVLACLLSLGIGLGSLLCGAEPATDQPAANGPQASELAGRYLRLRRDAQDRPLALETAVVRYTSAQRPGLTVDLVAAIHVGDKSYYDALNRLFEEYEVVLYVLVAPEGTRIPKGGRRGFSTHPVGMLQDGLSSLLGLEHQLRCVDYTRPNFVHADMSPEEFERAMQRREESFSRLFLRLLGAGIAQSAARKGPSDAELLAALLAKNRAERLKTIMAEQFTSMDGVLAVLDGPQGSAILSERNIRCLEVFSRQVAEGKRRIAIFYGAAHLPDMERRLAADYGLKATATRWLTAWRLATEDGPAAAVERSP